VRDITKLLLKNVSLGKKASGIFKTTPLGLQRKAFFSMIIEFQWSLLTENSEQR
jgi:hypothetical protein